MNWLVWYVILSHCFFTFLLYRLTEDLPFSSRRPSEKLKGCNETIFDQTTTNSNSNGTNTISQQGSSVWCYGYRRSERICKFRNLCYSKSLREYLFFHGPLTVVEGVADQRCSPALLDLSSVNDHNLQFFNYLDAPVEALKSFTNITVVDQPSLVFHRFNPNNLMHVIHDDLLPLFHTLRHYFPDFSDSAKPFNAGVQLLFMEGRDEGPHFDLYELFSGRQPILEWSLNNDMLLCLRESVVGISKVTTWYDYGFKAPQGAKKNHTANGQMVHQFASYVSRVLGTTSNTTPEKSGYVILFSREFNRLILNELDLSFAIATNFNLKVIRISLETYTLKEIIAKVRNSAGIIGMHGSILSLAIFLQPGTFLVELFPYAINPENYTPYKTLAQLTDMNISYGSWQNKIRKNTVVHPNRTKAEGGITHLSLQEQNDILTADEIPRHLCCHNPYWLFRIYQDTIVDIQSFVQVVENVLNSSKTSPNRVLQRQNVYPGKISSVFCKGIETEQGTAVFVSWKPPWNFQFFEQQEVEYEVWIQNQTDQEYMAYALDNVTEHTFAENVQHNTSYSVWVRGVLNHNIGPFSNVCICTTG